MSSGTKIISVVIGVGVIIGASIWLGRQNQPRPSAPGALAEPPAAVGVAQGASNSTVAPRPAPTPQSSRTTNVPGAAAISVPAVSPASVGVITDWNEKIDEALKSGGEDREVAKTLLKSFSKFPPEGQVEAVQHISNLLPDEDYPELAKLMEDEKLPEDVLDQLIMDLLNRPNKIMLPELVQVAKNPQHPKAGEAKDFLELYLEEDYGTDWNLWQTKVGEWLKANPE